jgi:light-regulated signal transduction histidine kinase (bacteriophytochrome)
MENQEKNSNSSLKIIVGFLALMLMGSLVYIYKLSTETKQVQTVLSTTMTEKDSVLKDLQELKATYDAAIAENTSMSEELVVERDKVVKLMNDIEKSKGDTSKYKLEVSKLQNNLKVLMAENNGLKKQNTTLTTQRDSTVAVLGEAKKFNEVLVDQNDELSKTIEKGAKLSVLNMQTAAYKIKSSGKQIATDKAGRVDVLKISFTIAENQIAKSGDKEYYVQVIDSKNNVLGDRQTVNFDEKSLTYSFISKVKYENKTVNVSEDLPGKDFAKGTYFVNVFDKNELVSKTSFTLK